MPWLLLACVAVLSLPLVLMALIKHRLKGYRYTLPADTSSGLSSRTTTPHTIAIIGAGVAGMRAALLLAKRGCHVTLYEANDYLGGKLGSWKIPNPQSATGESWVSHGFHAIFGHYYNFKAFLNELGCNELQRVSDYEIFGLDGQRFGFKGLWKTPIFNLVSMAFLGVFRARDVVKAPTRDLMGLFLEYDKQTTFKKFDGVSFAKFDDLAALPRSLKLAFHTFGRAFFASPDKLSLAELIKCFHYYYLSQDSGLLYDYPTRDYQLWILEPFRKAFEAASGTIRLKTPISQISRAGSGFDLDGTNFDSVIVATPAQQAKTLVASLDSALDTQMKDIKKGQRYAVWRIWIDRDLRDGLAMFVITEKVRVLDSITLFHRYEKETIDSLKSPTKAVLELHCYALPDDVNDGDVRALFSQELEKHFPEMKGFAVLHESLQIRDDFTAFHVGQAALRPGVESGISGLYFAGDWVDLPIPAMLLEAACTSGLWAANSILRTLGLAQAPVETVATRGVLFGVPETKARRDAVQLLLK
jgi:carotenoid phi-ring synthase / carotenoid chi-ring synthase